MTRIGARVEQRLGRPRDRPTLTTSSSRWPRATRLGTSEAIVRRRARLARRRNRERQPHCAAPSSIEHLVYHRAEQARHRRTCEPRRAPARSVSAARHPRRGATSATSAAAIESDTEMAPRVTLTSSELRPGSWARSTAPRQKQPAERDQEKRTRPAPGPLEAGHDWRLSARACDRSTASPRTGTPCCRRCRCCPRCRPPDRRSSAG